MSAFTPQYPSASNPQQLAQQLFQVPAQGPQVPAPMNPTAGIPTNSGVGFPATAAQVAPATSSPMYPVQPAPAYPVPQQQPAYPMPQQQQPLMYQMPQQPAPQQPVAPPQQPVAPAKTVINQLVQSNQLSAADATLFRSDMDLYNFLLDTVRRPDEPGQATQPTAPASPSPAQQTPPAQTPDDFTRSLLSLQQSGAVTLENGRYVAKYPEFSAITERANMEQIRAQQALFELSDPKAWFKKHGQEVLQETMAPLQTEIQRLRSELANSLPQPHEGWIAKNESKLRAVDPMTGQTVLTQAGQVYDSVYKDLQRYGTRDPRALHEGAARAAEAVMAAAPVVQPQQQTSPMTFMQAAAANPLPPTPGFNLPGTQLSRAQANQYQIPVTNQRTVDFRAIGEGILNGQIPREF